jgi:hypothetical protein
MGASVAVCSSLQCAPNAAEDVYEESRRGQCVCQWVREIFWVARPVRIAQEAVSCHIVAGTWAAIEILTAGGAYFNDPGFPLHLAAVENFLLKTLKEKGVSIDDVITAFAADQLATNEEQKNPFFMFLAGRKADALALTTKECPSREAPSVGLPQEWAWERMDVETKARSSMYWDCIFMANLLESAK